MKVVFVLFDSLNRRSLEQYGAETIQTPNFSRLAEKSITSYSHLISDHYHYWEDGGATYHNCYTSYDIVRGQKRDPWNAMVQTPWESIKEKHHPKQHSEERRNVFYHYIFNREFIYEQNEFPSFQCFAKGIEFLDHNCDADDWFLQIETFDPHQPYHSPAGYNTPEEEVARFSLDVA